MDSKPLTSLSSDIPNTVSFQHASSSINQISDNNNNIYNNHHHNNNDTVSSSKKDTTEKPNLHLQPVPPDLSNNTVVPSPTLQDSADQILKTYTQLSITGVPHDGFAEGNDITKEIKSPTTQAARWAELVYQGTKRWSVSDDKEAARILQACDRYGFFAPNQNPHNRIAKLNKKTFNSLPSITTRNSISNRLSPLSPRHSSSSPSSRRRSASSVSINSASSSLSRQNSFTSNLSSNNNNHDDHDNNNDNNNNSNKLDSNYNSSQDTHKKEKQRKKEVERIDKWSDMLFVSARDAGGNALEWSFDPSFFSAARRYEQLRRRVYKGIPDRWRRAAWGALIDHYCSQTLEKSRTESTSQLQSQVNQYLSQSSTQDVQIDLDVPRTISNHILFHTRYGQGQRALFQVLHGLSLQCSECGYVQGMGPIAATLLCYFEPERAYASFIRMHDNYNLHRLFIPGFPGLLKAFHMQEKLVEWLMPDVSEILMHHGIHISSYATKWYITIYANVVPFETQLRIWDAFLLDGLNVLVVMGFAIVWGLRHRIREKDASFESILSALSSSIILESDDNLMQWIMKVVGEAEVRKRLSIWADEWTRDNNMNFS